MKQLLTYLFNKEKQKNGERQLIIRRNVRSRSLEKWVKEFKVNESYRLRRRKDNVKAYHTVLSISNLDKQHVDEKMLRDIARKYISLRGRDSMFLGTAHFDKEHIHIHLVMSGTKYLTGQSNRISKREFQSLKLSLDAFQREKYPKLVHSLPEHGRSKKLHISQQERQLQNRNGRLTQKQSLLQLLEKTFATSKSLYHFLSHLQAQGHEPYYRAGKLTGVKFDGERKFRLNRLGYDEKKLQELERNKTREEKMLSELRELREKNSPANERSDTADSKTDKEDGKEYDKDDDRNDIEL